MTADEYCQIIKCAAENKVTDLVIDNFSIKFHNKDSIEIREANIQPVFATSDKPNHPEITETITDNEDEEALLKAEELSLMAIESPSEFENLLAFDDELLDEFKKEVEEIEE